MYKKTAQKLTLGYNFALSIDYQILCKYMLNINKQKNLDSIILEISKCLMEILDYELFAFVLERGNKPEVWIDPTSYQPIFINVISNEFKCQKNDLVVHGLSENKAKNSHKNDVLDINGLVSYKIQDGRYVSRLYVMPGKKMLPYHDNIINTILSAMQIALENNRDDRPRAREEVKDPLTQCYTKQSLLNFLESDIAYAERHESAVSAIMLSIDNLCAVNEIYGYPAEHTIIKDITTLIMSSVHKYDYLSRYGDNAFALILPNTALANAVQIAEKLRRTVEEHSIVFGQHKITVTASFGVATHRERKDCMSMLQEAEDQLCQAKSFGKNCVVPRVLPGRAGNTNAAALLEHPLVVVSAA